MRFILVGFAVVALLVATSGRSHAAPTEEQWWAALLKSADAGPGFSTAQETTFGLGVPNVYALYRSPGPPVEVVGVLLADIAGGSPAEVTEGVVRGVAILDPDAKVETVPPPPIGRGTVRQRFSAQAAGVALTGEVLGWQQGEVLALVLVFGGAPDRVIELATRQQARLTITFTSMIDCTAFAYQEEAQAVLALDPSDPYHLDPAGSGTACPQLPPRPAAAPAVTGPPTPTASLPPAVPATPVLPVTPTTTPSPTPSNPANGLIGQTASICFGGRTHLDIRIEQAEWRDQIPGVTIEGRWVVVTASATNVGVESEMPTISLRDERGRSYQVIIDVTSSMAKQIVLPNGTVFNPNLRSSLNVDYVLLNLPSNVHWLPLEVPPGSTVRVAYVFAVPADVLRLQVQTTYPCA